LKIHPSGWFLVHLVSAGDTRAKEFASASRAVGVAGERDDFGMMNEAVDHRGGDDVVGEDLTPPAKGGWKAPKWSGDELEEQLGPSWSKTR
jgi:hypothetical protein